MDAKGLVKLYHKWIEYEDNSSKAKNLDKDRLGIFRGGNVGCIGPKGEVYGECPRTCLARSWGYNGSVEPDKHLMFQGGRLNELGWEERFKAVLDPTSRVIPEGDPESVVSWELPNGRKIGGSPDGIIVDKDGDKVLLEYKRISSAWTARKVSIKCKPKKSHVIQAIHYMGVSNLSKGLLIYTQDVSFSCPTVGQPAEKLWPETSDIVVYRNEYPFSVKPHISVYDLMIDEEGTAWFKHSDAQDWTKTEITAKGIYDFYDLVDKQETESILGKKPARKSPFGDSGDSSGACDYCDHKELCSNKALSFDEFKKDVTSRIDRSVK